MQDDVTQADREAAASVAVEFFRAQWEDDLTPEKLEEALAVLKDSQLSGKSDDKLFVQAFAKHRLLAIHKTREDCAKVADRLDPDRANRIAAAIRAMGK